jgi:archaellum biogenesis protein FlaJ (TadC family)
MPIDRALWYAVRPGFGVLAKEIETVAKNTMAGEDLSSALTNFANKYNSKIIQRSISLLLEGMAAGGELADLLNKVAMNIEETKLIKKEMASSVTTYVIFIIFATIIAAPVLFGLSTQLLEVIKAITGRLGPTMSSSGSMMGFSFSGDAIKTSDFRIFAYLMLSISAFSSACIISIIRKGRVKDGLAQIPVFIIVSLLIYTFASLLIKGMFSSLF